MGLKVLLIDADMRNPSLHKKMGHDNTVGLSNYLTGACTPPEALQKTSATNLALMPSGPPPPNAADLLGGPRLISLLTVGTEVFDLIVMDGPPVLGLADAPLLSSAAVATIFVTGAGQARAGGVRGAIKRLQLARANIVGAVLTKFDARNAGYGYGYGYNYNYSYGQRSAVPVGVQDATGNAGQLRAPRA
jgi:polysaccharide biosynthesis transport protein